MPEEEKRDTLYILALALAKVIRKLVFDRSGGMKFSKDPVLHRKGIIEFMKKMRVFDIEKFNTPTIISTVNFYLTPEAQKKQEAYGFVVVYIPEDYVPILASLLRYPEVNSKSIEELHSACGTICNVIAGQFKSEVSQLSSVELEMSPFADCKNSVLTGVDFYPGELEKYEISFELSGEKRIVVEFSMGPIPLKL